MKPNCRMKQEERENANCPAFRQNKGCWEVDWEAIITDLPGSLREFWISFLSTCENCEVYSAHSEMMQDRIDTVRSLFKDD